MKHLFILVILSFSYTYPKAQNAVDYDDCEIKVRELVFKSINNTPKEVSVYRNESGEIYLREGHDSLNDSSLVTFFKKNKIMRKCNEFYDILVDSTSAQIIPNYFSDAYAISNSDYLNLNMVEFSFLLQQFDEPFLHDSTRGLIIRMVYKQHNYIDSQTDRQQRYNLVRYHREADSLIFKSGYFDKELRLVIDYSTTHKLNNREAKRLSKVLQRINVSDQEPIYENNLTPQRLFEFSKGSSNNVFFRAAYYSEEVDDYMLINNILYSCLSYLKPKKF
ncbi:MAG: hypothetical protein M0Q90_17165 [Bacteroidales bacterium]|nr:hypothetical protein [Bacteroidales bacterium]